MLTQVKYLTCGQAFFCKCDYFLLCTSNDLKLFSYFLGTTLKQRNTILQTKTNPAGYLHGIAAIDLNITIHGLLQHTHPAKLYSNFMARGALMFLLGWPLSFEIMLEILK